MAYFDSFSPIFGDFCACNENKLTLKVAKTLVPTYFINFNPIKEKYVAKRVKNAEILGENH